MPSESGLDSFIEGDRRGAAVRDASQVSRTRVRGGGALRRVPLLSLPSPRRRAPHQFVLYPVRIPPKQGNWLAPLGDQAAGERLSQRPPAALIRIGMAQREASEEAVGTPNEGLVGKAVVGRRHDPYLNGEAACGCGLTRARVPRSRSITVRSYPSRSSARVCAIQSSASMLSRPSQRSRSFGVRQLESIDRAWILAGSALRSGA